MGTGSWGTTFAVVLADAGAQGDDVGPPGRGLPRRSRERHRNTRLPRRPRAAGHVTAVHRRRRGAGRRRASSCSPSRRRRCARTSTGWRPLLPPASVPGQPDEGRRARHAPADERGRRGGGRRRARPRRRGLRAQPGPRDRRAGSRPPPSSRAPTTTSPSSSRQRLLDRATSARTRNTDVVGVELGGAVKNVIAPRGRASPRGMGFGDNTKASIITRGLAETARLGIGARRRADDVRRPGRAWATWSRPAPRRCRATAPSASTSARG